MHRTLAVLAAAAGLSACATTAPTAPPTAGQTYGDYLTARFADSQRDHQAALDRYFDALGRGEQAPALIDGAIAASLSSGDVEGARRAARYDERLQADLAAARIVRAADDLRAQRYREARRETEGLTGDGLELVVARMLSIWAEAGAGRPDDALAAIDAIDAPRPFSDLMAMQRAMILDLARRPDAAATAYAAARAGGLRIAPALVREIDLRARAGETEGLYALFAESDGRIRDPDVARAVAAAQAGAPAPRRAFSAARGAAISLYGLAALLMDQREEERALTLLTLSRMLDPEFDLTLILFANAQSALAQADAARTTLAAVPDHSPYAETARAQAAWILRRDNRAEEALAEAQRAAAGGGRMAQLTLGDLYQSLERWDEAEAVYTQIINATDAADRDDWILYFSRAATRDQLGRWPEAEADLETALAISPNQPEALNYLGYSWVNRGERLEEGLALIERAVQMRPQSAQIIDSLGWAHYQLGQYDTAIGHLERAVELEPTDPTLNDHLGDALWRLGRRTEARFQWRRALSLDPKPGQRAAIERKLVEGLAGDEPMAAQR
ncbi:MAG: tetratricopeptide repeat protein [Alphaproteobacteria bacterium]|nr:tetratricopeptide repeat protein [Alphaproteobacteria bacterium]